MNKKVYLLCLGLLWLLAACSLANGLNRTPTPAATGEPSPNETAVSVVTPAPEFTPDIAIPATAVTQTQPTLRVWIPPEIAISTEEGAAILNAQLAAFRTNHPDVEIIVEQKMVSGQSGILNYLRTGRGIASAILPDLIAIPTEQLKPALAEDLIHPLDGLIEVSLLEDLFPAALDLVFDENENQIGGYPFAVTGMSHLAYYQEEITSTVPATWPLFIELPNKFVFPANGQTGGVLGLQLYLAAGGTLTNEAGQSTLQIEPLATALQQLASAKMEGFILDQSGNYASLQESWQLFQAGTADITLTNAQQYLRQREGAETLQFSAVPGLERPLTPLINGWAWALSTSDNTQQALAAQLLTSLVASNQLGEWSQASYFLPARQAALAFWPEDDPYVSFAREQLNRAEALPVSSANRLMTALNNAVFDVVTLAKTPQVAAEEASAALQP